MTDSQEQLGDAATAPRILLTGATGFVGSHVVEACSNAGLRVRALVRSPERAIRLRNLGADLVVGSLEDAPAVAAACRDVDVVVHMAALTHARTDAEYEAVNVAGTARLLDATLSAEPRAERFVYLSSLAAVGPCVEGRAVQREDEPRPLTAYGRSKLAGEHVVLEAADRIETVILRAPAVYGPGDTDLYHFFRLASWGVIPVPTGPLRRLQLVHVRDLAAALVRAVTAPRAAGVYHIAEPRMYTWEEVGRLVAAAVGRRARVVRVPAALLAGAASASEWAAGLVGRSSIFNRDKARVMLAPGWLCETDSARADLEYEAAIGLADGLRETARWYRQEGWL
ncbi:MAG TPA: NAD-dependent epimerase/dehydratase family protein [Longimicrobiales bacterium]|nr:NAD-dependent epimerase/dehydratase family protein [Longimicrobiales bacterium]